jgi:lipid II:glycine glycyltransferase (peptidoglycan interpeptide bridge formation enzyme)
MSYFSHILELDRPAANIHSGFRAGVRRAIRKAERAGVKVELRHDLDSVRAFYKLHCKTRRRHGLPPQPFGFFRSIQRNVLARDQGFVLLANLEGRPIAGAILFQFGSVATYKFAASDPAYQQHRGNDLVVWEAVRYLTGHVRTLDFGRTSLLHEGLRRFKLGFGSAEVIIDYYQYDYQRSRFIQTQDWTTGFHNRLFRWLPVPVLRILGNLLYRNMGLGVTFDLIKHCVLES